MSGDKEYDVFLSHSSADKEFVERLTDGLEAGGVRVWLDQIEMGFGDSLFDHIAAGIEKARFFAIVLSQNSIQSKWVRAELKAALNRELAEDRTFVIPIVIEDIDIPTFLGDKIYADFRTEENFDNVLKALVNKTALVKPPESLARGYSDGNVTYYPDRFLPDLRFFVGRKELLTAIRETLDRDHRAVLHNISGIGKTFTSYQYAHENEKGYDKIFLVRATKEEWLESLAKNGEAVDPDLSNVTEQEVKAKGFKDWLESNGNWLVIYDNVDLPQQLYPLIPLTDNGDCLFTSNFEGSVLLGTDVGIEKMEVDDAGKLLYNRSVGKLDAAPDLDGKEKEAFENLLKEIDGLPVTLTSFGAVIFEKKWSFERAWAEYNKTPEIAWESEAFYSPYQHRSAGRIFSLVYEELTKDRKTGKAVKLVLDSVSFISPDEIPEELLQRILKEQHPPYAEAEDPDAIWDDIRDKLTTSDLLKYDRTKKIFTTHRAIQRVIQSSLKGKEKEVCAKLAAVLRGLFPLYDYLNRDECERYYQHVLVLVENADRFGAETGDTNGLYFNLRRYQRLMGNYALAERFSLRATEISAAVFGEESTSHATDLNDLAVIYNDQGRYDEAIEQYEEALRTYEKTLGKEHSYYAINLNNLANIYYAQGRYDEAIEKYEESLRIVEKAIGKEHPDYATGLNNLALVYKTQGRYDEAIEKYEEALRIGERTIGREHPDYAKRLNNLASVYQARGELEQAEKLYEQAREIREKTLGKLHPDTASTYWWIGVLRSEQKRYSEALPLFEEAYRQFVHFLGEEHPSTKKLKSHLETCREKIKKG
jgi:tetratricopeptide (TPR) repeat protein